jgi:hypothetical protein
VYVTGQTWNAQNLPEYVTIAYDAVTGKALWTTRYDNGGNDQGRAIAIGPSGHVVYVTGRSFAKNTGYDDATIAYDAVTGRKLWVARYNGKASQDEFANAITVAPDGKSVYVTGGSDGRTSRIDFATVRYGVATGKQLWVGRYNGPGNLNDSLARPRNCQSDGVRGDDHIVGIMAGLDLPEVLVGVGRQERLGGRRCVRDVVVAVAGVPRGERILERPRLAADRGDSLRCGSRARAVDRVAGIYGGQGAAVAFGSAQRAI